MESILGPGVRPRHSTDAATLALGCFASICRDRLGDRLLAFARAWPAVDVGVHEMPAGELLAGARDGSLALAVLPGARREGLRSAMLWEDGVMVAFAPGHALAASVAVPPGALLRERFLIARQDHGGEMHRFLAQRIAPLTPLAGVLVNAGLPHVLEQVATGEGVALVCAGQAAACGSGVELRPVAAPAARFPVNAYWRGGDPDWPLSALLDALRAG